MRSSSMGPGDFLSVFQNDRFSVFQNDRFSVFQNDRFFVFQNDRCTLLGFQDWILSRDDLLLLLILQLLLLLVFIITMFVYGPSISVGSKPSFINLIPIWGIPKLRIPPKWLVYRWEPIKMDDLGVPPLMETSI